MNDDDPDIDDLADSIARIEARFNKLAEDYNTLRREINELERKVERRT